MKVALSVLGTSLGLFLVTIIFLCTMEFAHGASAIERVIVGYDGVAYAESYGPLSLFFTRRDIETRRHEHMHASVQPRRLGWGIIGHVRFALQYNKETKLRGYWGNRFELEAISAETDQSRDAQLPALR